jgi:hypothetical protein
MGDDIIGVSRVYYGVTIAVENDGREGWPVSRNGRRITGPKRVS